MKKLISFIVAILLFSVSTSLAEEFTMRNGIKFGMTPAEVDKLETLPRDTASLVKYYGYGEIAGIKNSGVQYHFTDDKLTEVEFNFDALHKNSKATVIREYADVNALLQTKYGDPAGNKNGSSSVLRGGEFKGFISVYSLWKSMDYEEWLIEVDGGYVKIDHFLVNSSNLVHTLEYTYFSYKDVQSLLGDV